MSLIFDPPVLAHRGASAYAPENTLAAFTKAAQQGAKWVEFDVMLAACGTPVIFHDDYLDRTTNGYGILSQFSYTYLRTLDAGSWFQPIYAGERIPSLRQIIEFLANTNLSANVEIKAFPGQADELVRQILKEFNNYPNILESKILFSSFSTEVLNVLRKIAPTSKIGLLLHKWKKNWEETADSLNCMSIHVNHEIMHEEAAKKIKASGKNLLCYTVNHPDRAKVLFSWGVDAVFTDVPDKIIASCKHG